MSRSLRLHPAAQRELDEAAAYYDAESPGLGSAFLSELEHALQQIRAFPQAAPVGLGSVRVRVLVAFPYSLHYTLLDDAVLVLSLAHHRAAAVRAHHERSPHRRLPQPAHARLPPR